MFCQITADEERRVRQRIVVVQHQSLVFPTIQASSCAQHPSNTLKLPGTTVCLPYDHMVQIHGGLCLSNQKTQQTTPWSLTDSSVLFLVAAKFHTHTHCSSSSFFVTLSLIWWTACAPAQFSGCSPMTNARSEMGQMAICSQNLTLGAPCSGWHAI